MCMYIISGDELGNLATVINTKNSETWTNQVKVISFNPILLGLLWSFSVWCHPMKIPLPDLQST